MSLRPCIVMAYSGARAPHAVPWVIGRFGADVVTATLDLGDGHDAEGARVRALGAGARRAHVFDARESLARATIEALRHLQPPVGVARSLIARTLADVAVMEAAQAVACRGGGPAAAGPAVAELVGPLLGPGVTVITVPDEVVGLRMRGRTPRRRRTAPVSAGARVAVGFEDGMPVSVNGVLMELVELMDSLATITGREPAEAVGAAYEAVGPQGGVWTGVVDLAGFDEPRIRGSRR